MKNIGIIGTGAYGIALALMFHENENKKKIEMWTKFDSEKDMLINERENKNVLPGIKIPDSIKITTNFEKFCKGKDLLVIAVPAGFVDDISKQLATCYKENMHICIASKGIEQDTCLFVNEVLEKYVKTKKIAVISGPSFAIDIAKKVPIGLSLATKNKYTEKLLKENLQNKYLKLRTTKDIIGIDICGSIKNVIAIASGILSGLGFPESTQAMFITESLHDIKNLIKALGGNKKTILSFAGFGDLLLTCTSIKSRNFRLGKMIVKENLKKKFWNTWKILLLRVFIPYNPFIL